VNRSGGKVDVENYHATTHGLGDDGPWTRVEQGQRMNFHPAQQAGASYQKIWTVLDLIRLFVCFLGMSRSSRLGDLFGLMLVLVLSAGATADLNSIGTTDSTVNFLLFCVLHGHLTERTNTHSREFGLSSPTSTSFSRQGVYPSRPLFTTVSRV
jgi:hypothetical protein